MRGLPAAIHADECAEEYNYHQSPDGGDGGDQIDDRRDAEGGPDEAAQDTKREFFDGFGSRTE
jgi:hypothetical protein